MKINRALSVAQALERGRTLSWALVRSLSQVKLGPVPAQIDLEELIVARFFSATEEIRLFRADRQWQTAQLICEPEDCTLERICRIRNHEFGGSITVSSTLEADEDGQMNIVCTRLTGWEDVT